MTTQVSARAVEGRPGRAAGSRLDVGPRGFAATVDLDVPAGLVFDLLADPAAAPVIDPAVREYRPDRLPMGPGTRTTIRLRVWGVPVRATSVVTQWVPGTRMVMRSERPARPVRVLATHDLTPLTGGRCRYTWSVRVVPSGPFGRPAARALARFLAADAVAQQARLAAEAHRRAAGGATATPPGPAPGRPGRSWP